ncbi:MAG: hypothetical protein LRS43_01405 [Desulfurococcales archaeon]|nr:hypothetical protein [Desulfurococcales archaeon]
MVSEAIVEAGSRLHAGFYYAGRAWSIRWGGLGFYSRSPRIVVVARECGALKIEAGEWAEEVLKALRLANARGVCLSVETSASKHVGLGTTTQVMLSSFLAVKALVSRLRQPSLDMVLSAATRLGRGRVSWVGTLLLYYGGFVVDSGAPTLAWPRPLTVLKVPEDWRFVIAIPGIERGMGEAEEAIALREPWEPEPAHYLLMASGALRLASGIARGDLDDAIKGLEAVQRGTGAYFSRLQGGIYRGQLAEIARRAESEGIILAQSSWGPTLYTIAHKNDAPSVSNTLKSIIGDVGLEATILVSEPRNEGAKIVLK